MSHSCTACCGHVGPGKYCYKCGLQGPPVEAPQTHHPTCYREHHACAVARLDRLRQATEVVAGERSVSPDLAVYLMHTSPAHVDLRILLVAVRDITEGR